MRRRDTPAIAWAKWRGNTATATRRPSSSTSSTARCGKMATAACGFPSTRPSCPCSPSASAELPAGDGWIFEPEVGRLSRARLPRRRRGLHPEPGREAARPLLPRAHRAAQGAAARSAACSTARSSSSARTGLDFEALQLRLHPAASRVKTLSAEIPASMVFFDLLCEGDRDLREMPFEERRATLASNPGRRDAAASSHAGDARPRCRRRLVRSASRAPASTASWRSRPRASYEPNKRVMLKVKHERECDCVVAGFRWHKGGERDCRRIAAPRALRRGQATSSMSASAPASPMRNGESSSAISLRTAPTTLDGHPWKDWAEARCRRWTRAAAARGREPLEPGQGSILGAAPPRAGRRGRLRPHAGNALPSYGAVPPLAPRQEAGRLHLRPARDRAAARACCHLRSRSVVSGATKRRKRDQHARSSFRESRNRSFQLPDRPMSGLGRHGFRLRRNDEVFGLATPPRRCVLRAPFAGRVVVGVGGFLGWAEGFGDVVEVDADACPGR